jgi:GTP pyrophosphokinase
MLTEVMMAVAETKTNISAVNARTHKNKTATVTLSLNISNITQLEQIMTRMRRTKDVFSVQRTIHGGMQGDKG